MSPKSPKASAPCCPSGMRSCAGQTRILRDLLPHSHPTSCSSSDASLLKVGSWERGSRYLLVNPQEQAQDPHLGSENTRSSELGLPRMGWSTC